MKLILYGAGKRCVELCKSCNDSKFKIIEIMDSNPAKWGQKIEHYIISSPRDLRQEEAKVCITVENPVIKKKIRDMLCEEYGLNTHQEIDYEELGRILCDNSEFFQKKLRNYKSSYAEEKIVFDCYASGLGLGGIESWTKQLAIELLQKESKEVYIISKAGEYIVPKELEQRVIFADRWSAEIYSREAIEALVDMIIELLPCQIITSQPGNLFIAANLIKKYFSNELKIISVIHGGKEEIYSAYIERGKSVDYYIGVSDDIVNAMIQKGIPTERLYKMSCPFNCDKEILRSYTQNIHEPIRIGYAGRIEIYQKRMDLMLKLISCLEEQGVNYRFEFAGTGTAMKDMQEEVFSNMLENKVSFLGNIERSEISVFWRRQDICVNVSDNEGRSISIIEAMGNGVIPVVTAVSGTREDITNGENGFLVDIGDYYTMAKRIGYLADNRNVLAILGKKAHDAVYPKSLMSEHLKFWIYILGL